MLYYSIPMDQMKMELAEPETPQVTTREYKDRLFRHLFSDKDRAIELYNAVADKSIASDAEVEFWQTNAVLARWNDLVPRNI